MFHSKLKNTAMKNKIIIIAALVAAFSLTGCDDFLTQTNNTSPNQETFFDSDEALAAATSPLYNYVWWQFNEKFYYGMGDGRANNITAPWSSYIYPYTNLTETALSEGLGDAWGALYSVVAQSNNTINNIRDYSTSAVTENAKNAAIAEARFMRGTAYWYIGSLWGRAIIYERTSDLVNNSAVPPHKLTDVMEFAIRDLEFAAKYLPETAADKGRVTKYSAFGMLSRIYLSMAGLTDDGVYNGQNIATNPNRGYRNTYYLDLAKKAALKVINESSYKLMDKYSDLFTYENNNCQEALFQLQWLSGSTDAIGWGANQPMQAFFGWSTMVADGTNWGGATYASWDLVRSYDKADRIRRHATIATYGELYPELYKKGGGYTYGVTETGDQYKTRCCIKKYVIGTIDDNGVSYKQSSGLNTHMLRVAEVYLNLAEAILGNSASTTDATALTYFNKVRQRAGMPVKAAITYADLKYERRIELAMEGQFWYDLVRRSYYQQQEVVNYLNSQERNATYKWEETEDCQYIKVKDVAGVAIAEAKHLTLPVADADRSKNPYLAGDPVSYTFTEDKITDLY
jgi:hypothetical protein